MSETTNESAAISIRRKWRVIDGDGKQCGVWVERFDGNPRRDETWALDCAARYFTGHEVQVQTTIKTVSDWEPVTLPEVQR